MTRVAAIYDIHGNLPALEAVLADLPRFSIDHIIVGGDVVPGPMPRETMARLLALDAPVHIIRGNGEAAVLAQMAGREHEIERLPESAREAIRWTAAQLGPEEARVMAEWPHTLHLRIPQIGDVLFCHATPRSDSAIFTRLTPEARLRPVFAGLGVRTVVCGHTHMPFDRRVGDVRVVNAGSVGMPFGEPGASWLLLDPDGGLQLRHTAYDLEAAAARIRATSYPDAAAFAAHHVLQPPAEAAMLDAFSRAELT